MLLYLFCLYWASNAHSSAQIIVEFKPVEAAVKVSGILMLPFFQSQNHHFMN